ncbi:beta-lactamase family protein [Arcticibacter tournemirensis]|nr:serine hydrolase [Arcticibacter tournemirensis]TQM51982.1 beta-lactamase family protein [Arcticibacter tournemirensis]
MKFAGLLLMFVMISVSLVAQKTDKWLAELLYSKGSPLFRKVLDNPGTYQYQVIYTRIDRDKQNKPHFKSYYLNTDRERYFNPASTVKLPTALLALEKLNEINVKGLDKYTDMITDSAFSGQTSVLKDVSSESGYPSIAHYVKKIFLVSDNDAYNRLYEWVGQQTLNEKLWKKGYTNTRITRRFWPMTDEENRHTNPISFLKDGKRIYQLPAAFSEAQFDFSKKVSIGNSYYNRDEVLIKEPMDFTRHNCFPLEDQQRILRSVLFPESVSKDKRFGLTADDYSFLYKYLSMLPRESDFPRYDTTEFFDSYAKFFIYRAEKRNIPRQMRIYSKAGWSYGFLTDNAYIADLENNCEFLISATIYVNSDGVLNDDKYDYETIGYPFFKELGEIIHQKEIQRNRKNKPDLSRFR